MVVVFDGKTVLAGLADVVAAVETDLLAVGVRVTAAVLLGILLGVRDCDDVADAAADVVGAEVVVLLALLDEEAEGEALLLAFLDGEAEAEMVLLALLDGEADREGDGQLAAICAAAFEALSGTSTTRPPKRLDVRPVLTSSGKKKGSPA